MEEQNGAPLTSSKMDHQDESLEPADETDGKVFFPTFYVLYICTFQVWSCFSENHRVAVIDKIISSWWFDISQK